MINAEIYESNLKYFKVKKRYGDKTQAYCPAHGDGCASLTITKGRKCTLFYCHAGCTVDEVLAAAGLEKKDTFYDVEPRSSNWRAYIESREKRRIEAVYNYVSINGGYAFTKVRMQGKKMIYGTLTNERFTYGLGGQTRKELCAIYAPGGVQAINKAISEDNPIFIPEGEKDADTLAKQGYTAFSYGGVNDWAADMAQLCRGAVVYVLADNDGPGRRIANIIQRDLQGIAKSTKVILPVTDIPKADISDYFAAGHSTAEFEQMLHREQNTVTEAVKGIAEHNTSIMPQGQQGRPLEQVLKGLCAEQYETSDKGFGRLFADVFKDKHRYNPSRKDFMRYDGKRWIDDIEGLSARGSAKALSDALVRYAINVDTEGK